MVQREYERLSAMDAMFLEIEDTSVPMHVGSVALFEAGKLANADGGLDFERIVAFAEAQLHKSPRLRQKLATIPFFDWPVWIDDASFSLGYHVRHTALPRPGDLRHFKRLAGRVLSQQLDRGKPLWEIWFVEGVEEGRFGVISKLHHCMADGVSSGDLLGMLMGTKPDYVAAPAPDWVPRPAPDGARLIGDEVARRVSGPLSLFDPPRRKTVRGEGTGDLLAFVRDATRGAWRAAQAGLRPVSVTPLNTAIGPHRRFDWMRLPLEEMRRIGHAADGTVNDVVLAVVAGAVRAFLERRGEPTDGVGFRAAVPVNVRTEAEEGQLGNRVSTLITELPVDEADPWRRLERVVATTRELKGSGQSQVVDLIGRVADWLPLGLMARVSRVSNRVVNMIVTNVPGPQVPVYLLGARMLESYPLVPLMTNEALNIALYSYDGWISWGFNADRDAVPDLHEFVESVPVGFQELVEACPGH